MVKVLAGLVVGATLWVHQWAQLWTSSTQWLMAGGIFLLAALAIWSRKKYRLRWALVLIGAFGLALLNTNYQAQQRLAQQLPPSEENKAFKLVVQIDGLARLNPTSRYVTATVLRSHPAGVPEQIALVWS